MIRYEPIDAGTLAVTLHCDSCEATFIREFTRDVMVPLAGRDTEQAAIEAGWRRNVPVPVTWPRVTERDKEDRPATIEQEPGTMIGDLCPDCSKATETV
jgi:hypothetical protein